MKQIGKFDTVCDNCGNVTENFDTFDEWQEHQPDTVALNICKPCQILELRKKKGEVK